MIRLEKSRWSHVSLGLFLKQVSGSQYSWCVAALVLVAVAQNLTERMLSVVVWCVTENIHCTAMRETKKTKSLYHSVPLSPSFVSIAVPTITAEVVSLSVSTAATWIAGEQHFHYVRPPEFSHRLTRVCQAQKHTKRTGRQACGAGNTRSWQSYRMNTLTIMCLSGSGSVGGGKRSDFWLFAWYVCVFVLSRHTHVAFITFHSWLHVSRQEGN